MVYVRSTAAPGKTGETRESKVSRLKHGLESRPKNGSIFFLLFTPWTSYVC